MRSARLGQAVTKKGNPRAVRRNRIKRIIRDEFRQQREALPDYDIVIQCFGGIADDRLRRELRTLFEQLRNEADKEHGNAHTARTD